MPFGSVLSKLKRICMTTADGQEINFENGFASKIGFKILGVPHVGMRLRARKIVANLPSKIGKMLDAGCGTGVYSFSLAGKAEKIEAVDISQKKIIYLKESNIFSNINFSKEDLCKLKFADGEFDLIVCSDVLEHIKNDERAFSELARVLAKNGTLLMTVPFDSKKNKFAYRKYGHERAGYTKEAIEKLCRKNGLSLKKTEGYSRNTTEKFSFITDEKFVRNKVVLGIVFYPVYLLSLVCDSLFKNSEPNGLFLKIAKS